MFSKFTTVAAVLVTLAALSGLQGISAADPKCKAGKELYCCSVTLPGGDDNVCNKYYPESGNTCNGPLGTFKCCVHTNGAIAYACIDPEPQN